MNKLRIAILGSTSHIAKGLINNFLLRREHILHLYVRSSETIEAFLAITGRTDDAVCIIHEGYEDFLNSSYDVVINCIGVGTAKKLKGNFPLYFTVTEEYDNLVLRYLGSHPHALYISFSSGAVYGRGHTTPVGEDTLNLVKVNHLAPEDYYGIVRLNAEAKHRALQHLNIVDLRVFSYFSRYIDLADGYFITDVMEAILHNKVLLTDSTNIVRDYLHPDDLFAMVMKCIQAGRINLAVDVNSSCPVSKKEILDYFTAEYGLKYEERVFTENASATGAKSNYYSTCNLASQMGYIPQFSSIDTLKDEARSILAH
jgi:nucleoside-diphosphate-sugar epimerase